MSSGIACNSNPHQQAERHYLRAQDWLNKNKPPEAMIELRRALQLEPGMAKAHHELARIYLRSGDLESGLQELSLAAQYAPENHEVHLQLGELLLRVRDFNAARKEAEFVLKKRPEEPSAKLVLAESLIGLNHLDAAWPVVGQVLRDDPKNARALLDLAALQLHARRWSEAEANLRKGWDLVPESWIPPMALSQLLEARGDLGGAEAVLKRAIGLSPTGLRQFHLLAAFYFRHGRFDEAQTLYQQIQSLGWNDARHRGILAEFYAKTGRLDEAEREYKRILAVEPEDRLNWQRLASLYLVMNRGAETRQIVDRLLRENRKDPQALLLRAGIELEDGRPDLALSYLREAQQIDPDSPFVYMQLARVYLMRGDVRLAEKALENSLTRDPGYLPAQIVLAQLQLRKGQPDQAIRDLQKALEQKPGVVEPYLVLAQAYALKGEFHLAEESLGRWVGGAPSLPDRAAILRVLAWVKLRRGRALEARNIVRRSLDWEPRSREGLYLLGLTYLAAKEPDQGLTTLEDHLRGCSDWAAGYEVLGTLSLQAGKTDSAVAAYQRALAFDGLSIQALLGLGEAFGLQGKLDLARSYTEKAAAKEPQNVFVHLRLGQLAEMRGDWNGAITAYKKVVDLDSDHAIAKNNLAWLYAEHGGNLDVALRLAQEARQAKPDDSRVADTLGWICVKKGLYKTGIAYLTESLKKNPDNPVYHFHVGIACYKLGMVTEAKVRLETALRLTPNFAGAQQARQILRIISGD